MNTKTMEGLIGARTNMEIVNTPMRVFREARRKGDLAAMERAMGYAGDFVGKAKEYETEADEGMKEEAKETREEAEARREEIIQKRREEREKFEEKLEEDRNTDRDTVEVSEEGKALLEEGKILLKDNVDSDNTTSNGTKDDIIKKPVTYTKTGELEQTRQSVEVSVSV